MQNRKTKTNTNLIPDPNRYRRRCPDPNARIQKFIHYMAIAIFAIAVLCDSGLSPSLSVVSKYELVSVSHRRLYGCGLESVFAAFISIPG